MSNRTIVEYEEDRLPFGPHWRLNIEYSASGKPDVFISVEWTNHDGSDPHSETILVADAPKVLAPLIEWLKEKENK